jgi:hypothetical protein
MRHDEPFTVQEWAEPPGTFTFIARQAAEEKADRGRRLVKRNTPDVYVRSVQAQAGASAFDQATPT